MKKVLVIVATVIVLILVGIPVSTRILGPRFIAVGAPTGKPIGEFDIPRPETSLLAVSIGVPLSMLNELANTRVPEEFEGSEQKDFHKNIKSGGYAWKAARGPIVFQNTGTSLAFAAAIQGAAQFQGNLDAKIIQIPLNGTADIAGTAGGTLSPEIQPNWSINPNLVPALNLSQASLSLGSIGKIDISDILSGSVGQLVQKEAQKLAPELNKSLDLRAQVDQLWQQAYLSEQVNDNPSIWLSVKPTQIQLAPIDYSAPEQVSVTVAIQSETFLTNLDPGAPVPAPLPDLVPLSAPVATDLNLPVIVSITELNDVLHDQSFEIDSGVGTQIKISEVEAKVGQQGLLNLKLNLKAEQSSFERGIEGEIWIQGRPIIDLEKQLLGFADIDFTVETRSKLTSVAAWLLEEILIKALESQLRISLADYKEELDEEVQKAIKSANLPEGIDVSIEDLDVQLADIYTITRSFPEAPDSPGIVVVIKATGDLATQINLIQLDQ